MAGCNRPATAPGAGTTTATDQTHAAAAPARRPGKLTAAQLEQVAASGKTGLWSETPEVCTSRKLRKPFFVVWNVQPSGARNVVLYLVQRAGERRVTRGGAVGGQRLGRWVRPGTTLLLRDADKKTELGKLVVGGKHC